MVLKRNQKHCPLMPGLAAYLYGWPNFGTKWRPCLYSNHVERHASKESGKPGQPKVLKGAQCKNRSHLALGRYVAYIKLTLK